MYQYYCVEVQQYVVRWRIQDPITCNSRGMCFHIKENNVYNNKATSIGPLLSIESEAVEHEECGSI